MNNLLSLPPDVLGQVFTSAHPDVKMRNGSLRLFRDLYHFGQVSKLANTFFESIIGSDCFKQSVHPSLSKAFSVDLKERTFWLKKCITSSAWEGKLSVSIKEIGTAFEQTVFEPKKDSWVFFQMEQERDAIYRIEWECEGDKETLKKETLKLENHLDAHAPYCDPYIAYSGGDWVAVQSGRSFRDRERESISIYSWKNKKEVKRLLLQISPVQIAMEKDHLFVLCENGREYILQIYNLAHSLETSETISRSLEVKHFYISPSTIYLFCNNGTKVFLKIIKKKGWELASDTFTLPPMCRHGDIRVNGNELLIMTFERESFELTSVEWVEDKFVSKTLATFQNTYWGIPVNWLIRDGYLFLQTCCRRKWYSVICDLDDQQQAPQITLLEGPEGGNFTYTYQPPESTSQIFATFFKCHHMFVTNGFNGESMRGSSKVWTIQPTHLLKGFDQ